ncbi:MAG: DnaA/Hda family protein, partial [Rikenellaceae bacterium]
MLQQTQTYTKVWQECLSLIQTQTTEEEFATWFKPIVPLEFDGNILRLGVPNKNYVYQLEGKYIPVLRPVIEKHYGLQTRLFYAVPKGGDNVTTTNSDISAIKQYNNQSSTADIKNPFVIPGIKKINIDPNLNSIYTFENFIEGDCNRLSRSASMAVSINPGNTPFNPLYIYGNSGLGKTHIVQAIGHEVRSRHPELTVLYV